LSTDRVQFLERNKAADLKNINNLWMNQKNNLIRELQRDPSNIQLLDPNNTPCRDFVSEDKMGLGKMFKTLELILETSNKPQELGDCLSSDPPFRCGAILFICCIATLKD
jgi:hypothetical protein